MLEALACDLLNKYVGAYVDNLSPESLSIAVWKGVVELDNLTLSKTALDELNLPIDVVSGSMKKLSLSIPWASLGSSPVVLVIDGLYLLATPKVENEYNAADEEEREYKKKLKLLAEFEALKNSKVVDKDHNNEGAQSGSSLVTKVANNLQVVIKNVHVRYEDKTSLPGEKISTGLTFSNFTLHSTNANWEKTFVQGVQDLAFKVFKLDDLCVYVNSGEKELISEKSLDKHGFVKNMLNLICNKENKMTDTKLDYILNPISCMIKGILNMKRPLDATKPLHDLEVSLPFLSFLLHEQQYQLGISIMEAFSRGLRAEKFRKFRPKTFTTAKSRWKFLRDCLFSTIQKRNRCKTAEYMAERRKYRLQYIDNYVAKLTKAKVEPSVQETLDLIERKFSFEDIRYFRCLGDVKVKKIKAKIVKKPAANTGWFGGWWGGGAQAATEPELEDGTEEAENFLTEAQTKEIYDAIGYSEADEISSSSLAKDYASSVLSVKLAKGSFILKNSEAQFLNISFEDLVSDFTHYAGRQGFDFAFGLEQFTVDDLIQKHSVLPHLVSISETALSKNKKKELFKCLYQSNPLIDNVDKQVFIKSKALDIVLDPIAIGRLLSFFSLPTAVDFSGEFTAAATGRLTQTANMLRNYAAEREVFLIDIQMDAPNIILPHKMDDPKSRMIICDLGFIGIHSIDNKNKAITEEPSTESESEDSEGFADAKEFHEPTKNQLPGISRNYSLEEEIYERYTFSFSNIQMLMCETGDDYHQLLGDSAKDELHIINKFNVNFEVARCFEQIDRFALFDVAACIPEIAIACSDNQLIDMARCASRFLKQLDKECNIFTTDPAFVEPPKNKPGLEELGGLALTVENNELADMATAPISALRPHTFVDFQGTFTLNSISISIFNSAADGTVPLFSFILSQISVKAELRPYDSRCDFTLYSMDLSYFRALENKKTEKFTIVTSKNVNNVNDGALISMNVLLTDELHPEYHTERESLPMTCDVSFNYLAVSVIPESVNDCKRFGRRLMKVMDKLFSSSTPALTQSQGELDTPLILKEQPSLSKIEPSPSKTKLKLKAKLGQFVLQFFQPLKSPHAWVKPGQLLLFTSFDNLSINAFSGDKSDKIEGQMGSLLVRDCSGALGDDKKDYYSDFCSNDAKHELFKFEITNTQNEVDVSLTMGELKVNFVRKFLEMLQIYVEDLSIDREWTQQMADAATNAAVEYSESVTKVSMNINISAPVIYVPRKVDSPEVFVFSLGKISITNAFKFDERGNEIDEILLSLSQMSIFTKNLSNNEDPVKFMDEISFDVNLNRQLESQPDYPDMCIQGELSNIDLFISQKAYQFAMGVLDDNIGFSFDEPEKIEELVEELSDDDDDDDEFVLALTDSEIDESDYDEVSAASKGKEKEKKITEEDDKKSLSSFSVSEKEKVPLTAEELKAVEKVNTQIILNLPKISIKLSCEMNVNRETGQIRIGSDKDSDLQVHDLALVRFNQLSVKFYQKVSMDFHIDFEIEGLNIRDMLQNDQESRLSHIVSDSAGDTNEAGSLASVTMDSIEPTSPHADEDAISVRRNIIIDFNVLALTVNLQTFVMLIDFFAIPDSISTKEDGSLISKVTSIDTNSPAVPATQFIEFKSRNLIVVLTKPRDDGGLEELYRVDATKFSCKVSQGGLYAGGMDVNGKLGRLTMKDLTRKDQMYQNILSTEKGCLAFRYTKVGDVCPVEAQLQGHSPVAKAGDNVIWARLTGIDLLFTKVFIDTLMAFLNDFTYLQEVLTYMRTGVENLALSRNYLDVEVSKLAIFAPTSVNDDEGFSFQIDKVAVSNYFYQKAFTKVEDGLPHDTSCILDIMEIDLSGMQMFTSKCTAPITGVPSPDTEMASNEVIELQSQLLQDCKLNLTLKRRFGEIDPCLRELVPQLDISGDLSNIFIIVTQSCYHRLLAFAAGNLSETTDWKSYAATDTQVREDLDSTTESDNVVEAMHTVTSVEDDLAMKVSMNFTGMSLQLNTVRMQIESGSTVRNSIDEPLALFEIKTSFLTLASRSTGHQTIDLTTRSMVITDKRPDTENILRTIFSNKASEDANCKEGLLTVSYVTDPVANCNHINIAVHETRSYIVLEFFLELQDFAVPQSVDDSSAGSLAASLNSNAAVAKPESPLIDMDVTVAISQPEFYLVTDNTKEKSAAILIQCQCLLKYSLQAEKKITEINVAINQLHLQSLWLGLEKSKTTILEPSDMDVLYIEKPIDGMRKKSRMSKSNTLAEGTKFSREVSFTAESLGARLSVNDYELFTKVMNAYSSQATVVSAQAVQYLTEATNLPETLCEDVLTDSRSDTKLALDTLQKIKTDKDFALRSKTLGSIGSTAKKKKSSLIKVVPSMIDDMVVKAKPKKKESSKKTLEKSYSGFSLSSDDDTSEYDSDDEDCPNSMYEDDTVTVSIGSFSCNFVDDLEDLVIEMFEFTMEDIIIDFHRHLARSDCEFGAIISCNFCNNAAMSWEPFLEPCRTTVSFSNDANSLTPDSVVLKSDTRIEFNLTRAMVTSLYNTMQSVQEQKEQEYWLNPVDKRNAFKPVLIKNTTGVPLQFWTNVDLCKRNWTIDGTGEVAIDARDLEINMDILSRSAAREHMKELSFYFKIWNWKAIEPINSYLIDSNIPYLLVPSEKDGLELDHIRYAMIDVKQSENNQKIFEVKSPTMLFNELKDDVKVIFEPATGYEGELEVIIKSVQTYNVPLLLSASSFRIQPVTKKDIEMSEELISWSSFVGKSGPYSSMITCPSTKSERPYLIALHVDNRCKTQDGHLPNHVFTLVHPLRVENALPCALTLNLQGSESIKIRAGGASFSTAMNTIDDISYSVVLSNFNPSEPLTLLATDNPKQDYFQVDSLDDKPYRLTINVTHQQSHPGRAHTLKLWVNYWMINRTGLNLYFKQIREKNEFISRGYEKDRVLMFSYKPNENLEEDEYDEMKRCLVKTDSCGWSDPLLLDAVGKVGVLKLNETTIMQAGKHHEIGVKVQAGVSRFLNTKIITFSPTIIFSNQSECVIEYIQSELIHKPDKANKMLPGQNIPFSSAIDVDVKSLCVKIPAETGDKWTYPFVVNAVGNFHVQLHTDDGSIVYIYVNISFTKATYVVVFGRTEKYFTPYVIKNKTLVDIEYKQVGCETSQLLPSHHQIMYSWDNYMAPEKALSVWIKDMPETAKDFNFNLQVEHDDTFYPRYFHIRTKGGLVVSAVKRQGLYKYETVLQLEVQDLDVNDKQLWCLTEDNRIFNKFYGTYLKTTDGKPGQKVYLEQPSTWGVSVDYWELSRRENTISIDKNPTLCLEIVKDEAESPVILEKRKNGPDEDTNNLQFFRAVPFIRGSGHYKSKVESDGPSRVLTLEEAPGKLDEIKKHVFVKTPDEPTASKILQELHVHFQQGIGISVIDSRPQELAYILFNNIDVELQASETDHLLALNIASIQIDDQLFSQPKRYRSNWKSVVFAPAESAKNPKSQSEDIPFFHFSCILEKDSPVDVTVIKEVNLLIQEFFFSIPEEFLYRTLHFVSLVTDFEAEIIKNKILQDNDEDPLGFLKTSDVMENISHTASSDRLYIGVLSLQPLVCETSLKRAFIDEAELEGIKELSGIPKIIFFRNLSLKFNMLMLSHVFDSTSNVVGIIRRHYQQQLLSHWYKILGAVDFLGNFSGTFSNISEGVKDFFYEPSQGITSSPGEFLDGFKKGTSSLLLGVSGGVSHGVSALAGVAAHGLATASFDDKYRRERHRIKEEGRDNATETIKSGFSLFGKSIASGISGIVTQPMRGAQSDGATGFVKGMGRGVIGVVAKPVGGVFDLTSDITAAIRDKAISVTPTAVPERLTRYIEPDKVIRPYNARAAEGQRMLWSIRALEEDELSEEIKDELYIAHLPLGAGMAVIISSARLLVVQVEVQEPEEIVSGASSSSVSNKTSRASLHKSSVSLKEQKKLVPIEYKSTENLKGATCGKKSKLALQQSPSALEKSLIERQKTNQSDWYAAEAERKDKLRKEANTKVVYTIKRQVLNREIVFTEVISEGDPPTYSVALRTNDSEQAAGTDSLASSSFFSRHSMSSSHRSQRELSINKWNIEVATENHAKLLMSHIRNGIKYQMKRAQAGEKAPGDKLSIRR